MLKVLGKSSSINVRKVLWAADEIGLALEREDWGSGFRDVTSPAFVALNPNGLLPVLIDGDFVLWESNTILRYLATAYGGEGLLPPAPRERARVEQWMDWQATELNSAWRYAFMALVRMSPRHADAQAVAQSIADWSRAMGILDDQLATTRAYVVGDRLTLADIPIGLSVNRWFMTPIASRPQFAAVSRYYDRLTAHAGFATHGRNSLP